MVGLHAIIREEFFALEMTIREKFPIFLKIFTPETNSTIFHIADEVFGVVFRYFFDITILSLPWFYVYIFFVFVVDQIREF